MKRIGLIAGRDWRAIILSPGALLVVGLYLGLAGYLFSVTVALTQEATLRYAYTSLSILTVLTIPLITMRLFSEEIRSGTFEVLLAHPVTDLEVVLGKFLAGWASFLAISLPTLGYLIVLEALGSPDWGPALAGFLGLQLVAATLVGLGVMVSACTHNQILAAVGAMIAGLLLVLAGTASYSIGGELGRALSYLALMEHFSSFRRGVIDSRAVVFFLGTTAVSLFLTVRIIESRRLKFGVVPATAEEGSRLTEWRSPRLCGLLLLLTAACLGEAVFSALSHRHWGLYQSLLVLLGLASAGSAAHLNWPRLRREIGERQPGLAGTVLVNSLLVVVIWALGTYLSSRYFFRLDLTRSGHYTLSQQTQETLAELPEPVEFYVVSSGPADLLQEIRDLLAEYAALTRRVRVEFIDPNRSPAEIERLRERFSLLSLPQDEILVVRGERSRRIPQSALFRHELRMVGERRLRGRAQFVGEAELTSALILLGQDAPGVAVFLSGHGERNPGDGSEEGAARCAAEMRRAGWEVVRHVITPGAGGRFPERTRVVVVAGPRKPLSNENLEALSAVLDAGGGVLALLDPGVDSGMESWLLPWNVRISPDVVLDLEDFVSSADPSSLYVTRFAQDHPIGKGMGPLAVVLPTARRIAVSLSNPNPYVSTRNFMHTSGKAWATLYRAGVKLEIDPNRDRRGPISLGMACERRQEIAGPGQRALEGRLVVIGDSDFASNRYIDMAGNLELFLNSIDWLTGRHELISVRPKVRDDRRLTLTPRQTKLLYWGNILLIPSLAMGMVCLGMYRRRKSV